MPATSPESDAFSKDLKARGFSFVGSTIIYAHMQAVGMVNDHLVDCFRYSRGPAARLALPLRDAVAKSAAHAPVAQLDRALPSEGRGHRFESCRVRQLLGRLPTHRDLLRHAIGAAQRRRRIGAELEARRQLDQPPHISVGEHRRALAVEVRPFGNEQVLRLGKVVGVDALGARVPASSRSQPLRLGKPLLLD